MSDRKKIEQYPNIHIISADIAENFRFFFFFTFIAYTRSRKKSNVHLRVADVWTECSLFSRKKKSQTSLSNKNRIRSITTNHANSAESKITKTEIHEWNWNCQIGRKRAQWACTHITNDRSASVNNRLKKLQWSEHTWKGRNRSAHVSGESWCGRKKRDERDGGRQHERSRRTPSLSILANEAGRRLETHIRRGGRSAGTGASSEGA